MLNYDKNAKLEMLKSNAIAYIEGTLTKERFDEEFNELLDWIIDIGTMNIPDISTHVNEDRGNAFLLDSHDNDVFCLQLYTVPIEGRLGVIRVITNDVEFAITK